MWNLFDMFDSLIQKEIDKNLATEKQKNTHLDQLGTRIQSPSSYRRPPIFISRPETLGSFVNKVHGEQAAHL